MGGCGGRRTRTAGTVEIIGASQCLFVYLGDKLLDDSRKESVTHRVLPVGVSWLEVRCLLPSLCSGRGAL